jgi:hypothetical protein
VTLASNPSLTQGNAGTSPGPVPGAQGNKKPHN